MVLNVWQHSDFFPTGEFRIAGSPRKKHSQNCQRVGTKKEVRIERRASDPTLRLTFFCLRAFNPVPYRTKKSRRKNFFFFLGFCLLTTIKSAAGIAIKDPLESI